MIKSIINSYLINVLKKTETISENLDVVAGELHVVPLFKIFGTQTHHYFVTVHAVVLRSKSYF